MPKRAKKRLIAAIGTAVAILIVIYCIAWLVSAIWKLLSPVVFVAILAIVISVPAAWIIRTFQKKLYINQKIKHYSNTQTIAEMSMLSHVGFEHYVATLYMAQGYKADVTRATGDGGIDIVLRKDGDMTGVQVKHYGVRSSVGRPDIQKLVGACKQIKCDNMLFVTSSFYTPGAIEAAKSLNVELVDGKQLEVLAKHAFGNEYRQKTLSFEFHRRMRQF